MIKYVLMDADDTLFNFIRSEAKAVSETMRHFGIEPTKSEVKRYSAVNDMHWKMLERGEITRDQVKLGRFTKFLEAYGREDEGVNFRDYYEETLSHTIFMLPHARDFLKNIYKELPLYLASNGILKVQTGRIAKAKVKKYFKDIFISEAVGYNKPTIEFFNACFERMGNPKKEEIVMVGDSLTSDIRGGITAGLVTIWYNPKNQENKTPYIPTYEVHNYNELSSLLLKLAEK